MIILGTNSIKDTGYDVDNSLRFNDDDSANLSRTKGTSDSTTKGTYSFWFKLSKTTGLTLIENGTASADRAIIYIASDSTLKIFSKIGNSTKLDLNTNRVFRDLNAWYNLVLAIDTTQGTASNRVKLYINGTQETSFGTETYPDQNDALRFFTSSEIEEIGIDFEDGGLFDGYMCEVVKIDNAQLDATSFGEFDSNSPNIWKPIDVSGLTFGTNGYYLDFEKDGTSTNFIDSSSNARAITVTGNVHHSFDQAKFNGSSIEFDGTNDSLDIADSSDFDFGTGDFTFEFFVFKQTSGKMAIFETRSSGSNNGFNLEFSAANKFEWYDPSIASGGDLPKDPSAISLNTWTHYAVVRNGTTCTMFKNGTSVGTPKDVGSNSQVSAGTPTIGESAAGANDFDGYLDEIRLSNTARYTSNFTVPTSAFTSDSNTVLLIQSKASNLIGADVSGQGNHFESSGITPEDQSTDNCTNNACTWNLLYRNSATFTQGNLVYQAPSSNPVFGSITTFGVNAGKWYAECKYVAGSNHYGIIGVCDEVFATLSGIGSDSSTDFGKAGSALGSTPSDCTVAYVINTGKIRNNNNNQNYGSGGGDGDIINIALDRDNRKVYFGINGTYENSGNPSSGSNGFDLSSQVTGDTYFLGVTNDTGDSETILDFNFGGGFGQTTVSSGNSDANGFGNFEHAVPTGFFAWNSKNLGSNG
nr:hypothetical protein [uncultured Mediterranean phage uvMED]